MPSSLFAFLTGGKKKIGIKDEKKWFFVEAIHSPLHLPPSLPRRQQRTFYSRVRESVVEGTDDR
jgi:hypothetical protein